LFLVHVDKHSAEAGYGGRNLLAGHLELRNEEIALDRGEEALFAEGDEVLGGASVNGVELVVDGFVGRVADRELVSLGEEQGTEGSVGVEEIERHVEGCTTVPVNHTEAVLERADLCAICFTTKQTLEHLHRTLQTVGIVANMANHSHIVMGTTLRSGGHSGEGEGE